MQFNKYNYICTTKNHIKMNIPTNLKYTKDHEWVLVDGDVATVGITDFAQKELGDIVYVEVETLDQTLDKDEVFGTVEAVKTVSDLFLPLSGEIIEFNEGIMELGRSQAPQSRETTRAEFGRKLLYQSIGDQYSPSTACAFRSSSETTVSAASCVARK